MSADISEEQTSQSSRPKFQNSDFESGTGISHSLIQLGKSYRIPTRTGPHLRNHVSHIVTLLSHESSQHTGESPTLNFVGQFIRSLLTLPRSRRQKTQYRFCSGAKLILIISISMLGYIRTRSNTPAANPIDTDSEIVMQVRDSAPNSLSLPLRSYKS